MLNKLGKGWSLCPKTLLIWIVVVIVSHVLYHCFVYNSFKSFFEVIMVRQNVLWSTTLHFSPLLEIGMMKALCFHASPQCLRIFFRVCTVCIAHCIVVVSGQASHMDLLRNLVIYPWDDFTSCNVKEILLYVFFICGGDKEGLKFEFLFVKMFLNTDLYWCRTISAISCMPLAKTSLPSFTALNVPLLLWRKKLDYL